MIDDYASMHRVAILISFVFITSCYNAPKIAEFDSVAWIESIEDCNEYRSESVNLLLKKPDNPMLKLNQNEVKELLGNPSRHRLFNRNQKFFYYDLDCEQQEVLSVRFDALGRVKEVNREIYTN